MKGKVKLVRVALLAVLVLSLAAVSTGTMAQQPEGGEIESIACGDNVSCNRSGWAARISNSGGGGVFLAEQDAYSVAIKGSGRPGVFGSSGAGIGVKGTSTNGAAIWGRSTNDVGLFGRSDNGIGAYVQGGLDQPSLILAENGSEQGTLWSDPDQMHSDLELYSNDEFWITIDEDQNSNATFQVRSGGVALELLEDGNLYLNDDLWLDGAWGGVHAAEDIHSGLMLGANWDINIMLDEDDNDIACFNIYESDGGLLEWWCEGSKGPVSNGPPAVAGQTSRGLRESYAITSAGVWSEDFGAAMLVDGQTTVAIDPLFAETVNLEAEYHVYMTPVGGEAVLLSVAAKSPTSFTVRGVTLDGSPASIRFDYRIVAKRLGYEGTRLEEAVVREYQAPPEKPDWGTREID